MKVLCCVFSGLTPLLPLRPKQCVPVPLRNWRHCDGGRYPEACFISQQHAPRLWRSEPARGCSLAFMKLLHNITAVFLKTARAHTCAAEPAAARHLGADMCKELRTKVLRLLPATSNGPSVHSEGHTGQLSHWREHVCVCAMFRQDTLRSERTQTVLLDLKQQQTTGPWTWRCIASVSCFPSGVLIMRTCWSFEGETNVFF